MYSSIMGPVAEDIVNGLAPLSLNATSVVVEEPSFQNPEIIFQEHPAVDDKGGY